MTSDDDPNPHLSARCETIVTDRGGKNYIRVVMLIILSVTRITAVFSEKQNSVAAALELLTSIKFWSL
jgi:hypothetical protein